MQAGFARSPEISEPDWQPISTPGAIGWLAFYALFLIHAIINKTGFLIIDHVNLIVHESGHLLFGWFGRTLGVWGGTLMELLVPLALAAYFTISRQTTGTAFTTFFLFENFLYISVYMADARTQQLPLVTVGDPENAEHDWFRIFSSLGILQHDTQIAAVTKCIGWLGMLGTLAWMVHRFLNAQRTKG